MSGLDGICGVDGCTQPLEMTWRPGARWRIRHGDGAEGETRFFDTSELGRHGYAPWVRELHQEAA